MPGRNEVLLSGKGGGVGAVFCLRRRSGRCSKKWAEGWGWVNFRWAAVEKKEELKEAPPSKLERMVFLVVETHEMLRLYYWCYSIFSKLSFVWKQKNHMVESASVAFLPKNASDSRRANAAGNFRLLSSWPMLQGVSWHLEEKSPDSEVMRRAVKKIKPDWEKMEMKAVILLFSGKLRKGNIISYSPYFFQLLRTWPKKAMRKTTPLWRVKTEIQKQIVVVLAGIFFCQQQQRESEEEKDRKSLVFFFLRHFLLSSLVHSLAFRAAERYLIYDRKGKGKGNREKRKWRKGKRKEEKSLIFRERKGEKADGWSYWPYQTKKMSV